MARRKKRATAYVNLKKLEDLMNERSWGIDDLAHESGVNVKTLRLIVAKEPVTPMKVRQLAQTFNVGADELFMRHPYALGGPDGVTPEEMVATIQQIVVTLKWEDFVKVEKWNSQKFVFNLTDAQFRMLFRAYIAGQLPDSIDRLAIPYISRRFDLWIAAKLLRTYHVDVVPLGKAASVELGEFFGDELELDDGVLAILMRWRGVRISLRHRTDNTFAKIWSATRDEMVMSRGRNPA